MLVRNKEMFVKHLRQGKMAKVRVSAGSEDILAGHRPGVPTDTYTLSYLYVKVPLAAPEALWRYLPDFGWRKFKTLDDFTYAFWNMYDVKLCSLQETTEFLVLNHLEKESQL